MSNINYAAQFRLVEPDDIDFLRELILAPKSKLHQLYLFFWDDNSLWSTWRHGRSAMLTQNPDRIIRMLSTYLPAIKKNHWDEVKCGLLIRDFDQEHVIDVSKLTNKFDVARAGSEWSKVFKQIEPENQDDSVIVESFPVSDMWIHCTSKWLNPI